MEAYSLDLRQRIVDACDDDDETREEIAQRFFVSVSFITKLLRRRKTGSIEAKPKAGGRRPAIVGKDRDRVEATVLEQPDATLAELCAKSPVTVSMMTMSRTLRRIGFTRKKRPFMRASVTRRG
jgi:transposase